MGFNLGQSDVRGFTWNREKKPRNLCQIDWWFSVLCILTQKIILASKQRTWSYNAMEGCEIWRKHFFVERSNGEITNICWMFWKYNKKGNFMFPLWAVGLAIRFCCMIHSLGFWRFLLLQCQQKFLLLLLKIHQFFEEILC